MRLEDDQRALLRLLLERDHSYENIASLLGIGVDAAREKARGALAEMAGEDPDAEVAITDYVLGQADSIARADVERRLRSDASTHEMTERLLIQLRLLVPAAALPTLPGEVPSAEESPSPQRTTPEKPAKASSAERAPRVEPKRAIPAVKLPKLPESLPTDRRVFAGAIGGLVVVVLIVLLATGAFGGGDDSGQTAGTAGQNGTATNAGGGNGRPTRAVLRPVGDQGDARGSALFGRTQDTPAIRVQASGLDPSPGGSSYMLWLYRSKSLALRFGSVNVGGDGRLAVQVAIPAEALALVAAGSFDAIDVSLTSRAVYRAEQRRADAAQRPPRYTGESVLRGEITGPLVERQATQGG